jgi:hypothetical protein
MTMRHSFDCTLINRNRLVIYMSLAALRAAWSLGSLALVMGSIGMRRLFFHLPIMAPAALQGTGLVSQNMALPSCASQSHGLRRQGSRGFIQTPRGDIIKCTVHGSASRVRLRFAVQGLGRSFTFAVCGLGFREIMEVKIVHNIDHSLQI